MTTAYAAMMYQGSGVPVTIRKAPQGYPDGDPDGHGDAQALGAQRTARDFLGFQRDGDQRRLSHRGRETDGSREGVHQQVVVPTNARLGGRSRRGELMRHGLADGKQGLLQTHEKQRQSCQHADETHRNPTQVRKFATEHEHLEHHEHEEDGRHVHRRADGGAGQAHGEFHPQATMP